MHMLMRYWEQILHGVRTLYAQILYGNEQSGQYVASLKERWNVSANTRTITILVLVVPLLVYVYIVVAVPPPDAVDKTYVTIPNGASLTTTLAVLEDAHVVRDSFWLKVLLKLTGEETHVFSGDYYFAHPVSLWTVYQRLTTGTFGIQAISFTVTEGETVAKIAARCEALLFRCQAASFIDKAATKEGYLFPDTYYIRPNTTEDELITLLEKTLYEKLEPYSADIRASDLSLHELLTMASIIEKEEHEDRDRRLISGVLRNRMKIGMPLQVDATFLYIMGKGSFDLSRKDLAKDSPYNTYVYQGLPPGPIGSPSLSSILAALYPTKTDALFYLADSHGTTYYSKTYEEHLKKKKKYIDDVRGK